MNCHSYKKASQAIYLVFGVNTMPLLTIEESHYIKLLRGRSQTPVWERDKQESRCSLLEKEYQHRSNSGECKNCSIAD